MTASLNHYLSDKRIYPFRGKSYYKVKNYKLSYYITKQIIDRLPHGVQEVELERNTQSSQRVKGLIKWDPSQKKIFLSESKIRTYYQAFEVE